MIFLTHSIREDSLFVDPKSGGSFRKRSFRIVCVFRGVLPFASTRLGIVPYSGFLSHRLISPWLFALLTLAKAKTGLHFGPLFPKTTFSPVMNQNIRNIAIIAHVDHGKTTLVDKLLKEGGVYRANQHVEERAMDSMDLEKEKGITIKAKNTSVHWHDKTINIVDTPGHADFGGEVERALRMVDGVLLVVDAYDGPQAQTRFVLRKALAHGLKVVIVINKIDRDNAEPAKMYDKVLELLMELNATEEQFDAPVVYGSGRDGYMMYHLGEEKKDMTPLFQTVLDHLPPPFAKPNEPFHMLGSNIDWSDYVGRIAVGKILGGTANIGQTLSVIPHPTTKPFLANITT